MEIIIGLLVIAVAFFIYVNINKPNSASNKKSSKQSKEEKILNENYEWMNERWNQAKKEKASGEPSSFPAWFFDDVTDSQLEVIERIGLTLSGGKPTKGEASDIIGLFEPIEERNEEILKFFKVPFNNMNQSKGRHEVDKLFRNTENLEKWNNRPASAMQKECYKFFGLKISKGLKHNDAQKYISDYLDELSEKDELKIDEWEAYQDIYEEINDPDFREDYEIKKISLSLYRNIINKLKDEGKSTLDLADDLDAVVDKLIEEKPEIQKTSKY